MACWSVDCGMAAAPPMLRSLLLSFEKNQGQAPAEVLFEARTAEYAVFLSRGAIDVRTKSHGGFRMRFAGGRAGVNLEALSPLPGRVNYIRGRDPRNWHVGIPTYGQVRYRGLYTDIDLVFHASPGGQLEYDFDVRPGADPGVIRMAFEGARPIEIDAQGNLVLAACGSKWLQHKPHIFQGQVPVDGRYVLSGTGEVGFAVKRFDRSKMLVIDPAISYATYLGTSNATNNVFSEINSIAVDGSGDVYVTGDTTSPDFPTTSGAYNTKFPSSCTGQCIDGFVAKLNPAGTALIYSTFLGGASGSGIAVDTAGNAYVTGTTTESDFPISPGAIWTTITPGGAGVLVKLDPSGAKLLYSTLLGDAFPGKPLIVSSSGDLYLGGTAKSANFPVLSAVQPHFGGGTCQAGYQAPPCTDAFVMRWRLSDMSLMYSTFLGGSSNDSAAGVAVDGSGNLYVSGTTYSQDFPVVHAIQATPGGGTCADPRNPGRIPCPNAFVAKISADGKSLLYSTYLGGKGNNVGGGIGVDASGNAVVAGATDALNFPTVHALQPTLQNGNCVVVNEIYGQGLCADAFVAKINAAGSALVFSTYFGGSSGVTSAGATGSVAVDAAGNAWIRMKSILPLPAGLPITSNALTPCLAYLGGLGDAGGTTTDLLAEFRPDGSLEYSAPFGADIVDIALDGNAKLYLTGTTRAADFPVTPGAYQVDLNGFFNGFVVKIDPASAPAPGLQLAAACVVNAATYTNSADTIEVTGYIAPGEIIAIFGSGFGPASGAGAVLDFQGRITTSLAGVTLTFDGVPAPLLYVQANQVNAIVPFEVAGKQQTTVQLQYNGTLSTTARLLVADAAPGVFTISGAGQQIAALNQDGTLNSLPNPAARGSIISMWATGMGKLTQEFADGQIVSGTAPLVNPPQIWIGGLAAQTTYLGQAPGLVAGAIQINAIVPQSAVPGPNSVKIGNAPMETATISVK